MMRWSAEDFQRTFSFTTQIGFINTIDVQILVTKCHIFLLMLVLRNCAVINYRYRQQFV